MTDRRNQPLKVELVDGALQISIGIGALQFVAEHAPGPPLTWYDEELGEYMIYPISDSVDFANDVLIELCREQEDGTTPVHVLFDNAMWKAIEEGSLGVDYEPVKWEG